MYGPKSLKPSREPVGELIHIILTQNTSDVNSDRTYAALRRAYDSWEDVAAASAPEIADVIRIGGLADIKAARIVDVLARLEADHGHIGLGALGGMDDDEASRTSHLCLASVLRLQRVCSCSPWADLYFQ